MIIVKQESIYDIDVYTFKSSRGTPYQLTFEVNDSDCFHDVALVNLTGQQDSPYCKELRSTVSELVFNYLLKHRCKLYFNIEYSNEQKLILLFKFLRWIKLDSRVSPNIEITNQNDIEFIEVQLELAKNFISQIEVKG